MLVEDSLHGIGTSDADYMVMEYETSSEKWSTLPLYRASRFAMTIINSQVVLVGGRDRGVSSKELGVWKAESEEWMHPYPEMHTAHFRCSAVVYKEWLMVSGGWGDNGENMLSVEVMNIDSKHWYAASPSLVA